MMEESSQLATAFPWASSPGTSPFFICQMMTGATQPSTGTISLRSCEMWRKKAQDVGCNPFGASVIVSSRFSSAMARLGLRVHRRLLRLGGAQERADALADEQ